MVDCGSEAVEPSKVEEFTPANSRAAELLTDQLSAQIDCGNEVDSASQ